MLPKKNQPQKHPKKTNQDNTAPMGFALSVNLQGSRSSDYTITAMVQ